MKKQSNLLVSGNVNDDMRDLLGISFTACNWSKGYNLIYKNDPTCAIPKRLIELYVKYIEPDYNSMIYSFKNKYICNEMLVEKNDTKEQRRGLNLVYDFVQGYNSGDKPLDIFVAALKINSLLWQPTDLKNNEGSLEQKNEYRKKIESLKEEAKREKNLVKFKEARRLEKELSDYSHKTKIGGVLRSNNYEDEVKLNAIDIDVPAARDSMEYMNSFINPSKKKEFEDVLNNDNVIDYISYCVRITTKLIYYQPFMDGNKRTFRALLNLMFKERGLPPVYIKTSEREKYNSALYKGMKYEDYAELIGFYLFKICDSIYELDVLPYQEKRLKDYSMESSYGSIGDVEKGKKNLHG